MLRYIVSHKYISYLFLNCLKKFLKPEFETKTKTKNKKKKRNF